LAALGTGCASAQKRMEPVAPQQEQARSEFLERLQVEEQPALEAEWADWVKDRYPNWRTHYWVDRGQWGNRGYIVGRARSPASVPVNAELTPLPPAPVETDLAPVIVDEPPLVLEEPTRSTTYVVKKGDSLWRIAGKVYGNPLKWPRIYRANKDKIKNPHRIYPGQEFVIPQD